MRLRILLRILISSVLFLTSHFSAHAEEKIEYMSNYDLGELHERISRHKEGYQSVGYSRRLGERDPLVTFYVFNEGYKISDYYEKDPFTGEETYKYSTSKCQFSILFFTNATNKRMIVGGNHFSEPFLMRITEPNKRELGLVGQIPHTMLKNDGIDGDITINDSSARQIGYEDYPSREAAEQAGIENCRFEEDSQIENDSTAGGINNTLLIEGEKERRLLKNYSRIYLLQK